MSRAVRDRTRIRISCVWCGAFSETGVAGRSVGEVVADMRGRFFRDRPCGPVRGVFFRVAGFLNRIRD